MNHAAVIVDGENVLSTGASKVPKSCCYGWYLLQTTHKRFG